MRRDAYSCHRDPSKKEPPQIKNSNCQQANKLWDNTGRPQGLQGQAAWATAAGSPDRTVLPTAILRRQSTQGLSPQGSIFCQGMVQTTDSGDSYDRFSQKIVDAEMVGD